MNISKEIKVIREVLDLTQEELAKLICVSVDSIIRWEQNSVDIEERNIRPSISTGYVKVKGSSAEEDLYPTSMESLLSNSIFILNPNSDSIISSILLAV